MPNLTTEQQKDLEIYKKTGELGTLKNQLLGDTGTLKNLLIEHCLEELKCSDHARDKFNSILRLEIPENTDDLLISNGEYQIIFIQILLSRTPNGQAVLPFLDVEDWEAKAVKKVIDSNKQKIKTLEANDPENKWKYYFKIEVDHKEIYLIDLPKTLDHLLYREFTEILRTGKGLDKALETINKLYLDSLRNTK